MSAAIHIRRTRQGGKDLRAKSRLAANKPAPTLCGAEPQPSDTGRRDALHAEQYWRPIMWRTRGIPAYVREYFAGLCPVCLQRLQGSKVAP